MAIDDSFDFLRIHLQAADIDNSVGSSSEIAAVVAYIDHVAGIHKSVVVRDHGTCLAQIARGDAG